MQEGTDLTLVGWGAMMRWQRSAGTVWAQGRVDTAALGFGTEANRVLFVTHDGAEDSGVIPKRAIARELCDRLARLLDGEHSA